MPETKGNAASCRVYLGRNAALSALALLSLLLLPACARQPATPAPAAPHPWSWNTFPLSDHLLIAQLPASVVAVRAETVRAPVAGFLQLLPAARQAGPIAAGAAWATLEPESSPAEARELAQAQKDFSDRRARYRGYELAAELDKLDAEIAAANETVALARFAEHSPELFQGDAPPLDPRLKPAVTSAQAQSRLKSLKDRRKAVAAGDPAADPADLQAMAASLDSRRRALEENRTGRPVTAPVPGTLRLALSPEAEGIHVDAGQVLATIEDDTALEVVIRATLPLLHAAPAESLYCTVAGPGGTEVAAGFSAWGVDASGAGLTPVIRFRLPAGAFAGGRSNLAGVEMSALVFTRLPQPARIVPKLALAEWDQQGALAAGWRAGLHTLFPAASVLAEGRAEVALEPQ